MRNSVVRHLKVDSLVGLAAVVHILKVAELCLVVDNHLVVDHNCLL